MKSENAGGDRSSIVAKLAEHAPLAVLLVLA
ncbi:unnamed protein product, partial [marine sediment metagenome]